MKIRKSKTLAAQIAWVTGTALCVVFAILIGMTYFTTKGAIEESTFSELKGISKQNGLQVQAVLSDAESMSQNMADYMKNSMTNQQKVQMLLVNPEAEAQIYRSQIYPEATFKNFGINMESYFMSTLSSTVAGTNEIVGAGILYEPYIMSAAVRSYSIYADSNGQIGPYGEYDTYSQAAYYRGASEAKKMIFSEPYDVNGMKMITAATPIVITTNAIGVVIVDISLAKFTALNLSNSQYPSLQTSIVRGDGTIIYESVGLSNVGQSKLNRFSDSQDVEEVRSGLAAGKTFTTEVRNSDGKMVYEFYEPVSAGDETWYAVTSVQASDVSSAAVKTGRLLTILSIIALIILIAIVVSITRRQLEPISRMVSVANSIADGDLGVEMDEYADDEIGDLAKAFEQTIESLRSVIRGVTEVLTAISQNNLNMQVDMACKGEFITMEQAVEKILVDLNDVVGEISRSADQVAMNSEQVSGGAQALSQGATEQASSVEELAAALDEITIQVGSNAQDAENASVHVNDVASALLSSNEQMQQMMQAMHEISGSSQKIGNIIKTIEDIAFQTNILALNAAVEAARAGSAGKGFAVVADEVRNLASKSAEAAKDTTALIEESIRSVNHGVQIADSTAQSLASIVEKANEVTSIVERISDVTVKQADSINQVKAGIDQVSVVVQTTSATAQESAATAEELSGQAHLLKDIAGRFQLRN